MTDNFNDLMFEALDDTLRTVLGERVFSLVHSLTQKHLSMEIDEHQNVEAVMSYLEKLIGKEGARVLHSASIKRLCCKLRQEYEEVEAHFSVLDELYEMKFRLLTPLQKEKSDRGNPN